MTTYSQPAFSFHCSSLTSSLPLRPGAQTFGKRLINCTALTLQTLLQLSSAVPSNKTEAQCAVFFRLLHCSLFTCTRFDKLCLLPLQLNPLASQAAVAAAAAMGSIAGSQVFGNTLSNLQGATGQLVTNAQGQVSAVHEIPAVILKLVHLL